MWFSWTGFFSKFCKLLPLILQASDWYPLQTKIVGEKSAVSQIETESQESNEYQKFCELTWIGCKYLSVQEIVRFPAGTISSCFGSREELPNLTNYFSLATVNDETVLESWYLYLSSVPMPRWKNTEKAFSAWFVSSANWSAPPLSHASRGGRRLFLAKSCNVTVEMCEAGVEGLHCFRWAGGGERECISHFRFEICQINSGFFISFRASKGRLHAFVCSLPYKVQLD